MCWSGALPLQGLCCTCCHQCTEGLPHETLIVAAVCIAELGRGADHGVVSGM